MLSIFIFPAIVIVLLLDFYLPRAGFLFCQKHPPDGFKMTDLLAFIPSIRTIYFSGDVDGNDSLYCYWGTDATKITITCYNSEQRYTPTVNWLAIWRKNRPEEIA